MVSETKIFSTAVVSAKYNFLGQILFRIISFTLNAIIIRSVSKDILGIVNVRLMLLYSTAIFLGTEGFKRACLSKDKSFELQTVVNILWLCVPLTAFIAAILSYIWLFYLTKPDTSIMNYDLAVVLFAISTIIEAVSQIFYILSQLYHLVKLKTYFESSALIIKNVILLILINRYPQMGLLNFSLCQVLYSSILTLLYVTYFVWKIYSSTKIAGFFKDVKELLPKQLNISSIKSLDDKSPLPLVYSFTCQSFMKQFLTEGERYMMTFFDVLDFAQQGIYDLVNNLASLVARVVYLPLEDSAYFYFTQTMTREEESGNGSPSPKGEKEKQVGGHPPKMLTDLLSLVVCIGALALVFGPPYAETVLRLYVGDRQSHQLLPSSGRPPSSIIPEATRILQAYCPYLLLLGLNGISEAFAFATFAKTQIDSYNKVLVVFSLVFLALAAPLGLRLGPLGLVLANCLNMAARIAYALGYILRRCYGQRTSLTSAVTSFGRHIVPSPRTSAFLVSAALVTNFSNAYIFHGVTGSPTFYQYCGHLGVGLVMGLLSLLVIHRNEKGLSTFLKNCFGRTKED